MNVVADPAFQPPNGATLQLVVMQDSSQQTPDSLLTLNVSSSGGGTVQAQGNLSTLDQPIVVVPDVTVPPGVLSIVIDIKAGAFPNVVNLKSGGTMPVAIMSTPAFDAMSVDPTAITLDGATVRLVGQPPRPHCAAQDVNGDGRPDLVCHIVTSQLPAETDGVAVLNATAYPVPGTVAVPVQGADFIKSVK